MKIILPIILMASLAACLGVAHHQHKMTKAETFKACMDAFPPTDSTVESTAKVDGCSTAAEAASD